MTQSLLGSIITKPKLAEKHLGKPPFRFLLDIVISLTEATGFSRGLYPGDELKSEYYDSKEKKMTFLDKLISLVGQTLNTLVEAKPAKIVAGLEPQQTNHLLQLLAVAAVHVSDSGKFVARVLDQNGEAPSAPLVVPGMTERAQAKDTHADEAGSLSPPRQAAKGYQGQQMQVVIFDVDTLIPVTCLLSDEPFFSCLPPSHAPPTLCFSLSCRPLLWTDR